MDITTLWENQIKQILAIVQEGKIIQHIVELKQSQKNIEQEINYQKFLLQFITTIVSTQTEQFPGNPVEIIKNLQQEGEQYLIDFLDALMIMGHRLQSQKLKNDSQQQYFQVMYNNYLNFVKKLNESRTLIKNIKLQEFLDKDQSFDSQLLDRQTFKKKYNRLNTQKYYEQQKYNLFFEENEGYSKVIVELIEAKNFSNFESAEVIYNNIMHLIGYFDLDPDRISNMIVEAAIQNCEQIGYIHLIKHFKSSVILTFLGLKIKKNAEMNQNNLNKGIITDNIKETMRIHSNNIPDKKIFILAAKLIKANVIKLEDLWSYLSPDDNKFIKFYNERYELAVNFLKDSTKSFLGELTHQQELAIQQNKEIVSGYHLYNQKLWLLYTLVYINDWKNFSRIYFSLHSSIDVSSHKFLVDQLCNLLNWMIEKVYRPLSLSNLFQRQNPIQNNYYDESYPQDDQIKQPEQLDETFFEELEKLLIVLKCNIGHDSLVFIKICRIFKHMRDSKNKEKYEKFYERIYQIYINYLLPGIQIFNANPAVVQEFWQVYGEYNYNQRFEGYLKYTSVIQLQNPNLMYNVAQNRKIMKPILNKINKNNIKKYQKDIGKYSHNEPFTLFNDIIKRTTKGGHDSLIEIYVECFKQCTHFSLDIIGFLILRIILDKKEKQLNTITYQTLNWFKDCGSFITQFYTSFFNNDLLPLYIYFCDNFKEGYDEDSMNNALSTLHLFKRFLLQMTGYEIPEDLNETMLESFAGGLFLQFEALSLTEQIQKANQDTIPALKQLFWSKTQNLIEIKYEETQFQQEQNQDQEMEIEKIEKVQKISMAYNILILLSQMRGNFMQNYDCQLIQLSSNFDELTSTIMYFTRFLALNSENYTIYQELISENSLRQLTLDFKVSFELAFQICRNSFKPIYLLSQEEEKQFIKELKDIYDKQNPNTFYKQYESYSDDEGDFGGMGEIDMDAYFGRKEETDEKDKDKEIKVENQENQQNQGIKIEEGVKIEEEQEIEGEKKDKKQEILKTPQELYMNQHENIWKHITPELFSYFWMLNLDNLYLPSKAYETQIAKIQMQINHINNNDSYGKHKETDKMRDMIDNLKREHEKYQVRRENQEQILSNLSGFYEIQAGNDQQFEEFAYYFTQSCLLPRITLEPAQAIYCAKFLNNLLRIKKLKINKIIKCQKSIIFLILPYLQCATEQESSCIAIFLLELLQTYRDWNDENKFITHIQEVFDCERSKTCYKDQKQYIVNNSFIQNQGNTNKCQIQYSIFYYFLIFCIFFDFIQFFLNICNFFGFVQFF